jgi:hypothetical protein
MRWHNHELNKFLGIRIAFMSDGVGGGDTGADGAGSAGGDSGSVGGEAGGYSGAESGGYGTDAGYTSGFDGAFGALGGAQVPDSFGSLGEMGSTFGLSQGEMDGLSLMEGRSLWGDLVTGVFGNLIYDGLKFVTTEIGRAVSASPTNPASNGALGGQAEMGGQPEGP